MCTIATYDPLNPENGGGNIGYCARKETPQGNFVNATGYNESDFLKFVKPSFAESIH